MAQEAVRKQEEAITYGDVFEVSGELASEPVAPGDAAAMQAAESIIVGKTQKGCPAAVMQSAAATNESLGVVGHRALTDVVRNEGVTVSEAEVAGSRVVTEAVAGQVLGQFVCPGEEAKTAGLCSYERDAITIGEALEAASISAGDKPIEASDAAAIESAEMRATGLHHGGIGAQAQAAAARNLRVIRGQDKIKISHVLGDATEKLPVDKAVTKEDAEAVVGAEIRYDQGLETHPGGVASSMAAAARINHHQPIKPSIISKSQT